MECLALLALVPALEVEPDGLTLTLWSAASDSPFCKRSGGEGALGHPQVVPIVPEDLWR